MSRYGNCTNCGGELEYPEPHTVLATYPPKIALRCVECGNIECMRVETMPIVLELEYEKEKQQQELLERVAELEKKVAKLLGEEE